MSNLSKHILSGAIWTGFQTVGIKIVSLLGQIILAWLLVPEDFGKIALVYTITNVSFLVQQFGLNDVLIKRQKAFNLWLPLAKSLSLVVSALSLLVTLLFAFIGGWIYKDIEITYLVLIFSLSLPFQALSIIPSSKLSISLDFKAISVLKVVEVLLNQTGIVILALLGFKSYSFVIPPVLIAIGRLFWLYRYTGLSLRIKITLRRWKLLTVDSIYGFIHALVSRISFQIDYAVLGIFVSTAAVGLYYMAFTLSVQVVGFISASLPGVLFPSLAKSVPDATEMKNKMVQIIVFLSILGAPFALWQGTNAKALITLFLSDKWIETIFLVQILSLGMGFRVISSQWLVPLRLTGRFKKIALVSTVNLIFLVLIVIPLARCYGEVGTAWALSLFYMVSSPLLLFYGLKGLGIDYKSLFKKIYSPMLIALIAYGGVFYASEKLLDNSVLDIWVSLLVNSFISTIIYIVLIRFLMVREYSNLKSILLTKLLKRK